MLNTNTSMGIWTSKKVCLLSAFTYLLIIEHFAKDQTLVQCKLWPVRFSEFIVLEGRGERGEGGHLSSDSKCSTHVCVFGVAQPGADWKPALKAARTSLWRVHGHPAAPWARNAAATTAPTEPSWTDSRAPDRDTPSRRCTAADSMMSSTAATIPTAFSPMSTGTCGGWGK